MVRALLYTHTVLAKVHLGYRDGVQLPSATSGPAIYGNVISDRVDGVDVLQLWPYDFPISARSPESEPLATLWKPMVSGFLATEFGLTGYECRSAGSRPRWLLQRWFVQPMSRADIERNIRADWVRS